MSGWPKHVLHYPIFRIFASVVATISSQFFAFLQIYCYLPISMVQFVTLIDPSYLFIDCSMLNFLKLFLNPVLCYCGWKMLDFLVRYFGIFLIYCSKSEIFWIFNTSFLAGRTEILKMLPSLVQYFRCIKSLVNVRIISCKRSLRDGRVNLFLFFNLSIWS